MASVFDDPGASYLVLVNGEGQHSLWPTSIEVPAGWDVAHGPAGRAPCLDYVATYWDDLRPRTFAVPVPRRPPPPSGPSDVSDPREPARPVDDRGGRP